RYPVVMMHGFGLLAGMRRGGHLYAAAAHLRMHGVLAFAPNVVPYNTVDVRTGMWIDRLAHVLAETGADKLNLIAHSMGGLDARHLISRHGMHDRIATLTTIATPHRGTHIAEFIVTRPERVRQLLAELADWLGTTAVPEGEADFRTAVAELTPEHMVEHFNRENEDHPAVRYQSYGGAAGKGASVPANPFLRIGNGLLFATEGPNDGIVSVASARWGDYLGTIDADHAAQVGLSFGTGSRFSSNDFFLDLVRRLSSEGF
ncbi:MAG: alpha/beta fold hydrolase, partial [Rhodothermia bacterium]|nr:alpha/beta fold hydrolase [Rhodothermia bacterium]